MKERIREMYEDIHMPEACERAVRRLAGERRRDRPVRRSAAAVAAAMAVALVLLGASSNVVRAAVQEKVSQIIRYVFSGNSQAEIPQYSPHKDRVEIMDGRIYLCTMEESIDITDQISMETPYIHIYTDVSGRERILIIGGTPENMGFCEFFRIPQEDGTLAWRGGSGANNVDKDGNSYPWIQAAWEELDIPWPK